MGVPTFMYHADCPEGRVFDSDDIPEGWVDAPGKVDPKTVIDENNQADNVPLEDLHWKKLKKLVERAGGEYTGKDEAIQFLNDHS